MVRINRLFGTHYSANHAGGENNTKEGHREEPQRHDSSLYRSGKFNGWQ